MGLFWVLDEEVRVEGSSDGVVLKRLWWPLRRVAWGPKVGKHGEGR